MEKSTFKLLFAVLAIALLLLPAVTTFNEFLTRVVMKVEIYRLIQNFIVPFEAKMVSVVLRSVGIEALPTLTSVDIGRRQIIGNNVTIAWNCIGWQSLILLIITLITGLQGSFQVFGKIKTIIMGLSGTFLINIFRISFVVILSQYINPVASTVFHDYFSTLLTIAWLLFFWWFSYSYLLVPEGES